MSNKLTTTAAAVQIFDFAGPVFRNLLSEVKLLSLKKPEATLSPKKVEVINRVLTDLLTILKDESTGKYLELLSDEKLPQMSDAVLIMVQFSTALGAFRDKYWNGQKGAWRTS